MSNALVNRINAIKSNSNYLAHYKDASVLENGVLITLTYYKKYNGKAYRYTEEWLVVDADSTNYMDDNHTAIPVNTSYSSSISRVYMRRRRRWW